MEYEESTEYESHNYKNKKAIELVDANKFIILYIMSLSLYAVWWMYKAWKFFKEKEEPDIMPAARAIFALFFAYSLFERILNYAKENGYSSYYNSVFLFFGFIGLNMCGNLPEPIFFISFLACAFLIPVLRAFNFAVMNSDDYDAEEVERYSARQMLILMLGSIFWALVILGLLYPNGI